MDKFLLVAEVDGEKYVNRVDLVDFLVELADTIDISERVKRLFQALSQGMTIIGEPPEEAGIVGTLDIADAPSIRYFNHEKYGVYFHYQDYQDFLKSIVTRAGIKELEKVVEVVIRGLDMLVERATEEME
jgi:hypothetical protein